MPWARFEPQTLDEKLELTPRRSAGSSTSASSSSTGSSTRDESRVLGGSGLHPRGDDGSLEIGYWIRVDAIGQGLATEVTAVLTRVGFEHFGLDRVDLRSTPRTSAARRSRASSDSSRKDGCADACRRRPTAAARETQLMFTMLAEELAASPCAAFEYVAYDALGRTL